MIYGIQGQAFFIGPLAWFFGRGNLIGGGGYRAHKLVGRLYWVKYKAARVLVQ